MRPINVPAMPSAAFTDLRALAQWMHDFAREIEIASHDNDLAVLAEQYTLTGSLIEDRNLDVGSPDLTNVVSVLGTLLADARQGGSSLRSS
jgi:hypothetical protein